MYIKNKQMIELSILEPKERLNSFVTRVNDAVKLTKDINKEKRIKNFGHSHLETWRDIILEVSQSKLDEAYQL